MSSKELHASPKWARRFATAIALVASIGVGAFGLVKGTWAVGGSDSSCYGLMALAFARGELQPTSLIVRDVPWPSATTTFAPGGFIPSPTRSDGASPICAPGFSLLLAPFAWIAGPDGIFLVTPLAGALLVWLAFMFGTELAGPFAGAAAAVLAATTPVLLFQVVQPMNDVVVATVWLAVLVAASSPDPSRPWLLGALTGLAVVVRPNLAPAAVVVGVWLVVTTWRTRRRWGTGEAGLAPTMRGVTAFAIAFVPFAVMLLALNNALYGHPLRTGYESARDLFSLDHVWPNLGHYGTALIESQLGFPLLGIAALIVVPAAARSRVWLALGVSASVVAVYLLYRPFAEWWYLRFLLPALVPLTALAAGVLTRLGGTLHPAPGTRHRHPAPALRTGTRHPHTALRTPHTALRTPHTALRTLLIALIAFYGIYTSRERQVFDLQRIERRFRTTGELARDRAPANAVFITVWHSGTLRFHAGRPTMLWDSLDPASLDRAVSWFVDRGLDPYIVVEQWEEPLFRERFAGHSALGSLDWPPRFDIDRQVRIFKPSDRVIYLQGGSVETEYVYNR